MKRIQGHFTFAIIVNTKKLNASSFANNVSRTAFSLNLSPNRADCEHDYFQMQAFTP